MITLKKMLEQKTARLIAIGPEASVREALVMMASHNIGALLVMTGDRLDGIVSERDYARKVILQGRHSESTSVADIMTSQVYTLEDNKSVEDCMALMNERHFRHLPVTHQGQVIGLISVGDVVKEMMHQQKILIEQLQSYISG
jgi:CBS domain-containing protein